MCMLFEPWSGVRYATTAPRGIHQPLTYVRGNLLWGHLLRDSLLWNTFHGIASMEYTLWNTLLFPLLWLTLLWNNVLQ